MDSYILVEGLEIDKFQANDSEINAAPLCLGNVLKDFSVYNLKKTGLYVYVFDLSADYDRLMLMTF